MQSYKARGIVLHTVKYGDSSLVAYLLTDVAGRTSYMAQGVRQTGCLSEADCGDGFRGGVNAYG